MLYGRPFRFFGNYLVKNLSIIFGEMAAFIPVTQQEQFSPFCYFKVKLLNFKNLYYFIPL